MAPLVLNQISGSMKTIMLVSISASALLLSGCNKPASESTTANATSNGEEAPLNIKIATESSYKPFSYTDANGNVVGFEIDLTNALCDQMKAKCEIISQDWDGLIPGLNAKKFDIESAIKEGIAQDQAKKISKLVRDKGPKGVKATIQGDELRVSSKSRDDLQSVISLLKGEELDVDLQFVNFR